MIPGTSKFGLPGCVPGRGSNGMLLMWRYLDLSGGDRKFVVPSATNRSWVLVREDDDVTELTTSTIERALGAPMSDLQLILFL
jgi:hypothetical protein